MTLQRTFVLAAGLVLTALACAGAKKETPPMTEATGATLVLTAQRDKVAQAEDARLTLRLRNTGKGPLWLNQRMLVNAPHAAPHLREVTLDVTGPDQKPLPFIAKVRAGQAEAHHYGVLQPGEEHTAEIPLSRYHALSAPGTYTVVAHYHDQNPEPPPAPAGAVPFRGPLTSAPVKIEIQPAP